MRRFPMPSLALAALLLPGLVIPPVADAGPASAGVPRVAVVSPASEGILAAGGLADLVLPPQSSFAVASHDREADWVDGLGFGGPPLGGITLDLPTTMGADAFPEATLPAPARSISEPATLALVGLGLLAASWAPRRRPLAVPAAREAPSAAAVKLA